MPKTELVLSSATTFFTGRLEAAFRRAKKHGFRYLEILPYRWTTPEEVLALEKKYDIQVAGIHLPLWWHKTYWQLLREPTGLFEKIFNFTVQFYLNGAAKNTAWKILEALPAERPYLLFHANLISEMDRDKLAELKKKYNVVIENIPPLMAKTRPEWDLLEIKKNAPPVMDPAHYGPLRPELPDIYRQVLPNIVHIGYEHGFFFQHDLPNEKEFTALRHLLQIHSPRYLVLETYPWISVKKGKQVMEKLVREL